MADRDSSANNSRYSRSTKGIPQFGSFGPLPAGQRTTVSSNPQRVTEETLTEYMDKQSKDYSRTQPDIDALRASYSSRDEGTSMEHPSSPGTETQRLMSFDTSLEYHDAYRKHRDNAPSGVDLTTAGGGPFIDPPSYDQQKKE
ncbi:hypothetical protein V865_002111 [Kwoniella europaea PYCC6329]|uniref:Uncharacterized protein n=1 Tax=Kwoniella europaea PYCC6329 TaxID=1423913 RepID=A0AAX4KDG4_9TREE